MIEHCRVGSAIEDVVEWQSQSIGEVMSELDINIERNRLQAMLDAPSDALERAFKADVLDGGSQPYEWSDDTVRSCNTFWRIYSMGFKGRAPTAPVNVVPTETRAQREVRRQQADPKLATKGATAYERFLYAELVRLQSAVIADSAPQPTSN
jgi:hypothetical protein